VGVSAGAQHLKHTIAHLHATGREYV
jgi:hypothetical protein